MPPTFHWATSEHLPAGAVKSSSIRQPIDETSLSNASLRDYEFGFYDSLVLTQVLRRPKLRFGAIDVKHCVGGLIKNGAQGSVMVCDYDGPAISPRGAVGNDLTRYVQKVMPFPTLESAVAVYLSAERIFKRVSHRHVVRYLAGEVGSYGSLDGDSLLDAEDAGINTLIQRAGGIDGDDSVDWGDSELSLLDSARGTSDFFAVPIPSNKASEAPPANGKLFYVALIVPHYPDGDMEAWLGNGRRSPIPMRHVTCIALQLARALSCMHTGSNYPAEPVASHTPIVHADIKPANILFFSDFDQQKHAVLIDLDISLELESLTTPRPVVDTSRRRSVHGAEERPFTTGWCSPEQSESDGTDVSLASDVWSLGLVVLCLVAHRDCQELPLSANGGDEKLLHLPGPWVAGEVGSAVGSRLRAAVERKANAGINRCPSTCAAHKAVLKSKLPCLIADCLQYDRTKRPTSRDLEKRLTRILNTLLETPAQ